MSKIIPCYELCYLRYGFEYTKECDTTCDYAKTAKENKQNQDIIEYLLDMIEDEHMGMRASAIKEIKRKFGVEL